jgi:hypothetical protein
MVARASEPEKCGRGGGTPKPRNLQVPSTGSRFAVKEPGRPAAVLGRGAGNRLEAACQSGGVRDPSVGLDRLHNNVGAG